MLNEANQILSILLEEAAWAYKNGLDAPITRRERLADAVILINQLNIQAEQGAAGHEEKEVMMGA